MNVFQAWKNQELRKINALHSSQQTHTLVDGRRIVIHAETPQDENWVGRFVTFETLELLPPGQYIMAVTSASNIAAIIVGRESIIKKVLSTAALEAIERKIKAIK